MSTDFQHGVRLIESNEGIRATELLSPSIIGLVGTAPNADEEKFPLNTPTAIYGQLPNENDIGKSGTLYRALKSIFDQQPARVVIIRVDADDDDTDNVDESIDNVINGVELLQKAGAQTGLEPRIIIAPGYSQIQAVATQMVTTAERLRGVSIVDVTEGATPTEALAYRNKFDSDRIYLAYNSLYYYENGANRFQYLSAPAAGLFVKRDSKVDFAASPSNQTINGFVGTEHLVDFQLGDPNCLANVLNKDGINTVINYGGGYRLWGNRTLSSDSKWQFVSHRRISDIVGDSVQRAHLWAVDRKINAGLIETIVDGVNDFLRTMINQEIIISGSAWANTSLNSATSLDSGKLYIDFEFTAPSPAEDISFTSHKVITGYESII